MQHRQSVVDFASPNLLSLVDGCFLLYRADSGSHKRGMNKFKHRASSSELKNSFLCSQHWFYLEKSSDGSGSSKHATGWLDDTVAVKRKIIYIPSPVILWYWTLIWQIWIIILPAQFHEFFGPLSAFSIHGQSDHKMWFSVWHSHSCLKGKIFFLDTMRKSEFVSSRNSHSRHRDRNRCVHCFIFSHSAHDFKKQCSSLLQTIRFRAVQHTDWKQR